ncbi:tetratricopeptide repeat protein [Maribellus sp. YY47]|uniref:tetratricopeptide repeat protein n=1 Tax=Maribellus sp. YY47 TaxID=2929486 RepID=UPI002000DA8E|nr:tetratricopeptide repeat protein [Maribellus sp. YY47]MCK3685158.1 tetratricopeptide repeat protein [Maribellus sp. YY47]
MKGEEQIETVRMLLKTEKAAEAKEAFDRMPAFNTTDYYLVKGSLAQKFQQWGEAINAYNYALEIDPENIEAKNNLQFIQNILNFWNSDQFNP